jgi:hypothetical protein
MKRPKPEYIKSSFDVVSERYSKTGFNSGYSKILSGMAMTETKIGITPTPTVSSRAANTIKKSRTTKFTLSLRLRRKFSLLSAVIIRLFVLGVIGGLTRAAKIIFHMQPFSARRTFTEYYRISFSVLFLFLRKLTHCSFLMRFLSFSGITISPEWP